VLVLLTDSVLASVVPVSLAGIGRLFHVTPGSLTWVITMQLVAMGVCTPVFSRLGDIRGHRRVLRAAVLITAAGGVLIAVAPNFGLLLTGRALQGPVGAITPLAIGVLRGQASTSRLRRGIAAIVRPARHWAC
jgi:MFS family permease